MLECEQRSKYIPLKIRVDFGQQELLTLTYLTSQPVQETKEE
jgi:hypothetical protein